jgi:DnaB helicase-like protein
MADTDIATENTTTSRMAAPTGRPSTAAAPVITSDDVGTDAVAAAASQIDAMTPTRAGSPLGETNPQTSPASRDAGDPIAEWGPPLGSPPHDPDHGVFSGELDAPDIGARDSAELDRVYRRSPELLAEHALLGSLLQMPERLYDIDKFLHVRDFSTAETRTLFTTLSHLIREQMLTSLDSIDSHHDRYPASQLAHLRSDAALRNQQVLENAVRNHWYTDTSSVRAPAAAVQRLVTAAPVESLHLRGVYDPAAQLGLARDVLAAAIRRRVAGMGVLFERRDPLISQTTTIAKTSAETSDPTARTIHGRRDNLDFTRSDLERLASRWARATERTGPETITGPAATSLAAEAAGAAKPRPTGVLSAWRTRRAERHLIHVAMHSGRHLDPDLRPEHFSTPKYANTWRLLQGLHQRGEELNYVNVFKDAYIHRAVQPILTDKEILALGHTPPNTAPHRIASSLRTVITAALTRVSGHAGSAVTTAATNRAVPVTGLIDYTRRHLDALTSRTSTAATAHTRIANTYTPEGRTR